jgi:hypothetical protein
MITSNSIKQLGYTQKEAYSIMERLRRLRCTVKQVKQRSNYVRNGVICDYLHFCDAIDTKEAIEALEAYLERLPKNCSRAKWESILSNLKELDVH